MEFFSRCLLSYHSRMTTLYVIHSVNTYKAQITLRFGNVRRQMPVKNMHAKVLNPLQTCTFKLHFSWSSHISSLYYLHMYKNTASTVCSHYRLPFSEGHRQMSRPKSSSSCKPALHPPFLHFAQVMYSSTQQVQDLVTHPSVVSLKSLV